MDDLISWGIAAVLVGVAFVVARWKSRRDSHKRPGDD